MNKWLSAATSWRRGVTYVFVKTVIINEKDQVLVIRRSKTAPREPLWWDLPGGFVEFGEDPLAAALRETKEETGLEPSALKVLNVGSANSGHYSIMIAYVGRVKRPEVVLSYEHDLYKWIDRAELDELRLAEILKRDVLAAWGTNEPNEALNHDAQQGAHHKRK